MNIAFNKPFITGNEEIYIKDVLLKNKFSGDGHYTKKCHQWLEKNIAAKKALLTPSCTAALEMAAILADITPGDEVIMPSYTFVSTANAFVLRGGVPVFVDIRSDNLNIDEKKIENAITDKTKAIVVVHYAGVSCEMDEIMKIANNYNLLVIEDAAQAIGAYYKDKHLGAIGNFGCFSFHETKNVSSGEGGALIINDEQFIKRAEIIREKGTDRSRFLRGEIDKYTWVDIGSSYLPNEITAAFLYAQLEASQKITQKRLKIWNTYHNAFEGLEKKQKLKRPVISKFAKHNAHIYYLILENADIREKFIQILKENGINVVFHYIPLHISSFGKKLGKLSENLKNTENLSERLVRLPLYCDISKKDLDMVILAVKQFYKN
ncbi:MAG: dTDP-4-amino-4,6-dideoxygalactose transaminase [Spirochaetia bacterium]|nr:dTDP-4-amino-4,6-dideoxygalactose transaminase [Spirochaetia bacterium]